MIYYIVLFGVLLTRLPFKKNAEFFLWSGFYLFIASAVLDLLTIKELSEFIIRIGYMFLVIGLIFASKENKF